MNKITFDSVRTFTRNPSYTVHNDWKYLERILASWSERHSGIAALDLNPDFQRGHVWTPQQQTEYVEYILAGGLSGREIYFNCKGWQGNYEGPFVIVDGKQRLHAAREFLANRVPVFGGHYYKDIDGYMDAYFIFKVNDLPTRAQVLKWYLEMNTGGTPHTEEEINKVKKMLEETKKTS